MGAISEIADARRIDHASQALEYAEAVIAGTIPVCKWVKAACRRQLDDLERWRSDSAWPYDWRPELADRRIKFIELHVHVKGALAGLPLYLEAWQKFSVACVFGWVRKSDGRRRFRTVYEEVPRKNAKTTKLAALCLAMLTDDDEIGAEVYSAATKEEQARIVFDIALQMARMEPEFRARFGVQLFRKSIVVSETASKFVPLAASDGLDGLNVSFAAVDELHAHKTRAVHDVLDSATGARAQPLIWKITTAGSNRAGVCYDQRSYLTKILNAVLKRHGGMGHPVTGEVAEDEAFWGVIYTIDEGDDPLDEKVWRKANPNYGISVDPDDMRSMAQVAGVQAQALNEFLTKRLNVWVNADSAWMNMLQWDACGDPKLKEEDFAGEVCVAALDAAFKKDLFAKMKVFRREDDYFIFGRYYTNAEITQQKGNEHLAAWVRDGWIRTTPGNVLDIEVVRQELLLDTQRFQVAEVPFDPFQLQQFAAEMIDDGVPMVELRPTVLNFSPAMKEAEALVAAKRLHHNCDPVLAWAISNVVCHLDAKDNIYPRREKTDLAKKIDPAIALFMGLNRAMANAGPQRNVYEERGVISI